MDAYDHAELVPIRRARLGRSTIRMFGGLPDPALFPRALWLRHYRAVLAGLPDAELTYPDPRGAPLLRAALAAYLGRVRGVATSPERVVVCSGITQGLGLVCRALRRRGLRQIAVEEPSFALHRVAIAMAGLDPVPIPVDAAGMDVERLAAADVAGAVVVSAHSYPTGATLTAERRRELVAWASGCGAVVVEDDYDSELRYDRAPIGALQGHAPGRVVYLGSASKTLGAALRLGWIAAPPDLVEAVQLEKQIDDLGSTLLEQLAFARFVDHGDFARYLRRVRPVYRARRDAAIAAVAELLPVARCRGAAAGLHLQLDLPADVDVRALAAAAYDRGVLIENAALHYAQPASAPPSIVLGYGAFPEPTLRRAVSLIAAALADTGYDART